MSSLKPIDKQAFLVFGVELISGFIAYKLLVSSYPMDGHASDLIVFWLFGGASVVAYLCNLILAFKLLWNIKESIKSHKLALILVCAGIIFLPVITRHGLPTLSTPL